MNTFGKSLLTTSLFALSLGIGGCVNTMQVRHDHDDTQLAAAKAAFFDGWTKSESQTWTSAKLGQAVVNSGEFFSFDAMAPQGSFDGWDGYSTHWNGHMNQFKSAKLSEVKTIRSWHGGEVAVTCSAARIQGDMGEGKTFDMPGQLTLVYRKINGQWRVVHEHMSMPSPAH